MLRVYRSLFFLLLWSFLLLSQQNCVKTYDDLEGFTCTEDKQCGPKGRCINSRCGACNNNDDCASKGSGFVCCTPKEATGKITEMYCRTAAQCRTGETTSENATPEETSSSEQDANEATPPDTSPTESTPEASCMPLCTGLEVCCEGQCKNFLECARLKDCSNGEKCPPEQIFCCGPKAGSNSKKCVPRKLPELLATCTQ